MADPALFTREQNDDECLIRGLGARLWFRQANGRWTHHLGLDRGGLAPADREPGIIVSALDLDPDSGPDHEPGEPGGHVTPVYQELHYHELASDPAQSQCILLTGRAHKHVFSAAVTLARDLEHPGFATLEIDVADRCREPFVSLSAVYRVGLGAIELVEADRHAMVWCGGVLGTARLELRSEPPVTLALAESRGSSITVMATAPSSPEGYTHRLRYRWRWRWIAATEVEAGPDPDANR